MNVSCPECGSIFRIDPAKVPEAGVQARCSVCGALIAIAAPNVASVARPVAPEAVPDAVRELAMAGAATDAMRDEGVANPAPSTPAAAARDAEPSGAAEVRARPVNPYLNNTPELRARRLARALVSDLVAYNPQKREQGLRDGTLRQLFREEIRKSWDEYVDQVGATVAESTPHFQDALNDVLAGGRRVF